LMDSGVGAGIKATGYYLRNQMWQRRRSKNDKQNVCHLY
jgi:hypothetical protein